MINLVLFGPPGSGKGTQAKNLVEKYNIKQVSTGDLFRYNMKNDTELGKLAKSFISKGQLVPDQVTIDMLIDEVKKPFEGNGFVFDGFPRTTHQAEELDRILNDLFQAKVQLTLSLKVEEETLIKRLCERGKTSGRVDDADENIIRDRIKEYYTKTAEVADFYKKQNKFAEIDGVGDILEISEKLFEKVDAVK